MDAATPASSGIITFVNHELERSAQRPSLVRRAGAGVVLLVVGVLAIHFVIGLIMTIVWIAVAIAAVVAILWALNTLL